jgi:hypothetical protein
VSATAGGPGRLVVFVYALFAVAAGGRAAVQIGTKFSQAPLAYTLSAIAAAVYLVAAIAFARAGRTATRVAWVACSVELVGVLVVGTVSIVAGTAFPDDTVWSRYGSGYLFVPLVLPVAGLLWLARGRSRSG